MCKYEHELCKHDLRKLSNHEINQHYFEFVRNATREEYEENGWSVKNTRGLYKCRICGDISFHRKGVFKTQLKVCKNKCNGVKRGNSGNMVIVGYNDLATTHPHKIKHFSNVEDTHTHTYASNDKVDLICPDCGYVKQMAIDNFIKQGFSCDFCSDGISYPEKVMALFLNTLGIKFKKQHKFDNYGGYYYDFYLIDYDVIIEVHGGQHYEEINRYSSWKSYEDEHENDLVKYDIVVLNGYEYNKNYLIIDTKHSNIDYIKQSIYNCSYFKQFDLTNIDWQEIDIKAQKSVKFEVYEYWKQQKQINKDLTTVDVAKEFKVGRKAILDWLKWGNENGLCVYSGEEERKNKEGRQSKFVYFIKPDGTTKWFDEPMSKRGLAKVSGISVCAISRCVISGKPLEYSNSAKYDKKYVGSYIIACEIGSQDN